MPACFYFAGASAYNPTENTGRMFIQLKPHDERDVTSDQVIQRLRPKVAAVQGAKFFMQSGQDISVGGRLSRTQYQYTLTDTDSDELNHWAPIVEAAMRKLPDLQDVASDQQIAAPHIAIEIDRDAASRLGLVGLADRRDAVRRVRPAPDRDDVHLDQPIQGHPRGQAASSRAIRPRCRRSMSPGRTARRCR